MTRPGYTLIELLIVAVLLGIVASAAMWRMGRNAAGYTFTECQYKKAALRTLRAILAAERVYRVSQDVFTAELSELPIADVNARSTTDYPVQFDLTGTTTTDFVGTANYTRRSPALTLVTLTYDADQSDDTPADPRESITAEIACN